MKAVISGATRGIGRAVAEALAAEGYDLALAARSMTDLENLKKDLLGKHPQLEIITRSVDFAKSFEVKMFAETLLNHWGGVDVIVNNVGRYMVGSLTEEPSGALKESLQINLQSAHALTIPFLSGLKERGQGHIFTICSVLSQEPRKEAASYTIAKFALYGLHKVMLEEMRDSGVKVTALLPGSVNTSSWDGIEAPKENFVQPEEVASAIITALKTGPGVVTEEIVIRPLDKRF